MTVVLYRNCATFSWFSSILPSKIYSMF